MPETAPPSLSDLMSASDWEARLAEARAAREQALRDRQAARQAPPVTDPPAVSTDQPQPDHQPDHRPDHRSDLRPGSRPDAALRADPRPAAPARSPAMPLLAVLRAHPLALATGALVIGLGAGLALATGFHRSGAPQTGALSERGAEPGAEPGAAGDSGLPDGFTLYPAAPDGSAPSLLLPPRGHDGETIPDRRAALDLAAAAPTAAQAALRFPAAGAVSQSGLPQRAAFPAPPRPDPQVVAARQQAQAEARARARARAQAQARASQDPLEQALRQVRGFLSSLGR